MSYTRALGSSGACCSGCAAGASKCGGARSGLGAVDYEVHPGEDVYHYMARIAVEMQEEIKVASAMKDYDAKVAAADAAAAAVANATAAGFVVPPGAQQQVQDQLTSAMPTSTKLILAGVAGLALFMLMGRK